MEFFTVVPAIFSLLYQNQCVLFEGTYNAHVALLKVLTFNLAGGAFAHYDCPESSCRSGGHAYHPMMWLPFAILWFFLAIYFFNLLREAIHSLWSYAKALGVKQCADCAHQ
jgi:hypothetical protein